MGIATSGETLEIDDLVEMHPEFFPNTEETLILLGHLQKTGRVAVDTSHQTIVKFIPIEKETPGKVTKTVWKIGTVFSPTKGKEKPIEITEVDRSLATLKRTEKLLIEEIDKMETEVCSLQETARNRLREGSRGAVSYLGIRVNINSLDI